MNKVENKDITGRLDHIVKSLHYPSKTINKFREFALALKNINGESLLSDCYNTLAIADNNYSAGTITMDQTALVQIEVLKELFDVIRKEISIPTTNNFLDDSLFELDKVICQKRGNCLGIAQVIYILGCSLNLPVAVVEAVELMWDRHISPTPEAGHVCCIVGLRNGNAIMLDPVIRPVIFSVQIKLMSDYKADGLYLQLNNPILSMSLHKRIQLLYLEGIVACLFNSRGLIYHYKGNFGKAISFYNQALKNNPSYDKIFVNRGMAYDKQKKFQKAIADFDKAIILNKVCAVAYNNRGFAYYELENYPKALSDYCQAIHLNPQYALAYLNRGVVYHKQENYIRARTDYECAMRLNPSDQIARRNMEILAYDVKHRFDPRNIKFHANK